MKLTFVPRPGYKPPCNDSPLVAALRKTNGWTRLTNWNGVSRWQCACCISSTTETVIERSEAPSLHSHLPSCPIRQAIEAPPAVDPKADPWAGVELKPFMVVESNGGSKSPYVLVKDKNIADTWRAINEDGYAYAAVTDPQTCFIPRPDMKPEIVEGE